jgi:hypothetical protein
MTQQPPAPRFLGVVGVAFVLGSIVCANSLQEAYHYGTASRARETEQKIADDLVWGFAKRTTGNQLPPNVQPFADGARTGLVDLALRRRPILEALAITNAALGALLAAFAASAMRLRATGRTWLIQAAVAGIAFAIAQIVLGSIVGMERIGVLGPYLRALGALPDLPGYRAMGAIGPVLIGGAKIAFLVYLVVVMQRPAVRAMYRLKPH